MKKILSVKRLSQTAILYFIACIITCLIASLLIPVCDMKVQAEDVTVYNYDGLVDAINNASDGDIITISGTITVTDTITIENKELTIKGSGSLVGGDSSATRSLTDTGGFDSSASTTGTCFIITGSSSSVTFDGISIKYFADTAIIVKSGASLDILSGNYSDNIGKNGGAIKLISGSTVSVYGGTFSGNKAESGGAIISGEWNIYTSNVKDSATLQIYGGTFTGNEAGVAGLSFSNGSLTTNIVLAKRASIGGGAVWSDGNLNISGGTFSGNAAYNGDGGAVFINGGDTNYISAGTFTGNTAEQLGGAIYTEENSTTVFGECNITSNDAGHFGGGLWLCPSGQSTINRLGFAAIYANTADTSKDATTTVIKNGLNINHTSYAHGAAGDDIAVMYPNKGDDSDKSYIVLADTWFTEKTVEWYEDGRPTENANGYQYVVVDDDKNPLWSGFEVYHTTSADDSSSGTIRTTVVPRYADATNPVKYTSGTYYPAILVDEAGETGYGLAVKAVNYDTTGTDTAAIKITGNTAYWSGGGIGTNGSINFRTFGIISWQKKDETLSNSLAGSTWLLTNTSTGHTYLITDNGNLDLNSSDGVFKVSHLDTGTYTLVEVEAPEDYALNDTTYSVTLTEEDTITKEVVYIDGDGSNGAVIDYPIADTVTVKLYKKLNDTVTALDSFEFTLKAVSATTLSGGTLYDENGDEVSVPMPTGYDTSTNSITISSSAASAGSTVEVSFGEATYEYAGIYTYTISEVIDETSHDNIISFDTRSITVKVTVTENSTTGKLTATVTYDGASTVPTFVNKTHEEPDTPDTPSDDSDEPDEPETSDEPDTPTTPDTPSDDSDEPDEPETSDEPDTPTTPVLPAKPQETAETPTENVERSGASGDTANAARGSDTGDYGNISHKLLLLLAIVFLVAFIIWGDIKENNEWGK